jgi:quercetin dioxygenase-like cupin family protein
VNLFRRPASLSVLVLGAVAVLAIVLPTAFGASPPPPAPVRSALAQSSQVVGAPGRTMVLSKVTVPAGVKLALHHHQGTQISRVAAGTLTYTVRRGHADLYQGESEPADLVRRIGAGQTARVKTGQWLVEQPSDDHEAANRGSTPVVIYLSTLLKTGAPPSSPVALP